MKRNSICLRIALFTSLIYHSCSHQTAPSVYEEALQNGRLANEGFIRCRNFVNGWLEQADPETGLIPRNLDKSKDIWNAHDCGADNYPFMVLTAAITDRALFQGRMHDMLETEKRLTSRLGAIPDIYSFSKKDFLFPEVDVDRLMFGGSEYIKDGLLPLTEWLGPSSWSDRLLAILDDMWQNAPIQTPFGDIVSTNVEVNGEMLQVLSRIYWKTGDRTYLQWAKRLGDYYLLGENHPTRDFSELRLRDHGCEIVSGLCELYATVHFAEPQKKSVYQPHIYEMLDRILQVGRNEHGLFYNVINPQTGDIVNDGIADTFGYTYNGFYTVYLVDNLERFREPVLFGLSNLKYYQNYDWERGSADGYADAIESALNIYNREQLEPYADWIDSEIKVMWNKQQPSGIIEGWHGDGNFARTTIMYCLWKTQGVTIRPWRDDIVYGTVRDKKGIHISITAQKEWSGRIYFDTPRHQTIMNLPLDWPRINQFPEWFVLHEKRDYRFTGLDSIKSENGKNLEKGIRLVLQKGEKINFSTTIQE